MNQVRIPQNVGSGTVLLTLLPKIGLQLHNVTAAMQAAGEGLPLGRGQNGYMFTVDQVDAALAQHEHFRPEDRIAFKIALRNHGLLAEGAGR